MDIDVKDLTTRAANDVIASCAFGLKVDSQMDKDNKFYAMGRDLLTSNFLQTAKFLSMMCFPKVSEVSILEVVSLEFRLTKADSAILFSFNGGERRADEPLGGRCNHNRPQLWTVLDSRSVHCHPAW